MTTADRTYAQALADRRLELEEDHRTAVEYLDELRDELGTYADDPASVTDIRAHLLTVAAIRDEAAADLEEAWRLLAACGPSSAGRGLRRGRFASFATALTRPRA